MSPPPDAATLAGWLDGICSARGVTPAAPTTPGVEVVRREAGGRSWLFAINHSGTEATVPTAAGWTATSRRGLSSWTSPR